MMRQHVSLSSIVCAPRDDKGRLLFTAVLPSRTYHCYPRFSLKNQKNNFWFCTLIMACILFFVGISTLFAATGSFLRGENPVLGRGDRLSLYDKGNRVVLQGKVKLTKKDMIIYCDVANIFQKDGYMECTGNTCVERNYTTGNYIKAKIDTLIYNSATDYTTMKQVHRMDYFIKKDNKLIVMSADSMEMYAKDDVVLAKGNVSGKSAFVEEEDSTTVKGEYTFFADEATMSQLNDTMDAQGNVRLNKLYADGRYAKARSKSMHHDGTKKWGIMKELQDINYYSVADTATFTLTGDNVECFEDQHIAKAYKHVKFVKSTGELTITSDLATYYQNEGRLAFTEHPRIVQNDAKNAGVYTADTISYFPKTEDTTMEGNVQLEFEESTTGVR